MNPSQWTGSDSNPTAGSARRPFASAFYDSQLWALLSAIVNKSDAVSGLIFPTLSSLRRKVGWHLLPSGRMYDIARAQTWVEEHGSSIRMAGIQLVLDPRVLHDALFVNAVAAHTVYEPEVTAVLETRLKPGQVAIDVGANNGYFALISAKLVGPSGCVYAFEPNPAAFRRLIVNARANGFSNLRCLDTAVGVSAEDRELHLSDSDEAMSSFAPIPGSSTSIRVPVRTLDAVIPPNLSVDLLKVDVEGYERDVLEGATGLLRRSPAPLVVFEYNKFALRTARRRYDEVLDFLDREGFSVGELLAHGRVQPVRNHKQISGFVSNLIASR